MLGSSTKYPTVTTELSDGGYSWYDITGVQQVGGLIASGAITDVDATQNTLKNTGFGFNIPTNATIQGIVIEINRHASQNLSNRYRKDNVVRLLKSGAVIGDNKAYLDRKWESNAYNVIPYGNDHDLWGTTWTPSEINDANFGVNVQPIGTDTSGNTVSADIDFIRIIVYYTIPASTSFSPSTIKQNLDSRYSLEILDSSNDLIAEFSGRAKNRSIKLSRNNTYEASWSLDIDDLEKFARQININARSLLSAGQNRVAIKRINVPVFGGQIIYYDATLQDQRYVNIKAVGWLDLYKDRYTSVLREFTATDAGVIASTLISESQALSYGSFGTTIGTIKSSVNRDRTYEYKNIKEALIQLSEVHNGFDFEFTWDNIFNVYYPSMGVQRNEFEFVYPGNIKSIKISTDASGLLNYAILRGQGYGEGQIIDISQDVNSQIAYKRREVVLDYSDIPDADTLLQLGNEEVSIKKQPLEVIEITLDGNKEPFLGSYGLGDRVKVRVEGLQLYSNIDAFYRIDEIEVKIDDNDNEEVNLKLTL